MQEIVTIAIVLSISGLIYLVHNKAKSSRSTQSFMVVLFSLIIWAIFNYFSLHAPTEELTVFWIRAVMSVTMMLAMGMYLLGNYFPNNISAHSRYTTIFVIAISVFLSLISSFTELVISDVTISDGNISPSFGALIPLFGLSVIAVVGDFSYTTFRKYTRLKGKQKQQILYLATGLGLTASLAFITNFIFVVLIGVSDFVIYGPFFTLFFAYLTYISIIRHRLFDIRFLLGRIIYFSFLGAIVYSTFFILIFLFILFFESIFDPRTLIFAIPTSLVFVISFKRIDEALKNQITLKFINPGYNPLELIDQYSSKVSTLLDISEIARSLNNIIEKSIRPKNSQIVLITEKLKLSFSNQETNPFAENEVESLLQASRVIWSTIDPEQIILADEINPENMSSRYINLVNVAKDLHTLMEEYQVKLITPIHTKNGNRGILLSGEKEADFPYTYQDIEFITSLIKSTAVAIERSLLYTEVQEFANTLQDKVDEATKELQESNHNLQAALNQLQEARRRERDMIDVMGHELRTPMSIVRNALSLLEREYEKTGGNVDADKLKRYLDMGTESARREITLIETLLSATKIDASRIQLHLVKVDHKDVVGDSIESQVSLVQEKNLYLKFHKPNHEIFSYCDRTRVQQIMDNFLSNSAKYTQQGGIDISAWNDSDNAWISISDTGIGIDENDLYHLGKKFFRAKQYISNSPDDQKVIRPGGTGLGLYVTFELIRIMGGQLYINSGINKGTTFTWSMPLYKGQEENQIDQTFDNTNNQSSREHIHINQDPPKPPQDQLD